MIDSLFCFEMALYQAGFASRKNDQQCKLQDKKEITVWTFLPDILPYKLRHCTDRMPALFHLYGYQIAVCDIGNWNPFYLHCCAKRFPSWLFYLCTMKQEQISHFPGLILFCLWWSISILKIPFVNCLVTTFAVSLKLQWQHFNCCCV